jgi:universal stress protein A
MYNHVLIAIDTSQESEQVLRKGIELARLYGSRVEVIHVLELPMPMIGEMALVDTYFNSEEYMRVVKETMIGLLKKVNLPENSLHLEAGLPAAAVVSYAKDHQMDLIVTGSHGKSGLKLLLGSVASGILHKAGCDVLVYRLKGEAKG